MNPTQKIAEIYKQMRLDEAKKKMDPVGDADADIDNDGDVDDSDEYLHKRRKAIKKSMKEEKVECPKCKGEGCEHCDDKGYHEEAVQIDPDDGEVSKSKDDDKKKKKKDAESDTETPMDEVAEPSTELGKKFKNMHKVEVDDTEEKGHMDAVKANKAGPRAKQPKRVKELRK
jgi:hypothetical protein